MGCCTAQRDTLELWTVSLLSMFRWVFDSLCYMLFGEEKSPASEVSNREAVNEQATQLLDKYGSHILRLAYSYLHNMNDAEDVLQDTLIQFLKTTMTGPAHRRHEPLEVVN